MVRTHGQEALVAADPELRRRRERRRRVHRGARRRRRGRSRPAGSPTSGSRSRRRTGPSRRRPVRCRPAGRGAAARRRDPARPAARRSRRQPPTGRARRPDRRSAWSSLVASLIVARARRRGARPEPRRPAARRRGRSAGGRRRAPRPPSRRRRTRTRPSRRRSRAARSDDAAREPATSGRMSAVVARLRGLPSVQVTLAIALLVLGFLIAAQIAARGPADPLLDRGALAAHRDRARAAGAAGGAEGRRSSRSAARIGELEAQDPGAADSLRRAVRGPRGGAPRGRPDRGLRAGRRLPPRGRHAAAPASTPSSRRATCASLIEELWLAGAEAIAVNGERIVGSTAVIDIGGSILVNSAYLAPPYTITADRAAATCTTGCAASVVVRRVRPAAGSSASGIRLSRRRARRGRTCRRSPGPSSLRYRRSRRVAVTSRPRCPLRDPADRPARDGSQPPERRGSSRRCSASSRSASCAGRRACRASRPCPRRS